MMRWALLVVLVGCGAESLPVPCLEPIEDEPGAVMVWGDVEGPVMRWQVAPVSEQVLWLGDVSEPVDGRLMVSVAVQEASAWDAPRVRWVLQGDERVEGFAGVCGE